MKCTKRFAFDRSYSSHFSLDLKKHLVRVLERRRTRKSEKDRTDRDRMIRSFFSLDSPRKLKELKRARQEVETREQGRLLALEIYLENLRRKMVGVAGFEPTTFCSQSRVLLEP